MEPLPVHKRVTGNDLLNGDETMNSLKTLMLGILPLGILAVPMTALAAEKEVTIEVVAESDAEPGRVAEQLSLPRTASEQAQQRAAVGLETANQAREKREESGRETARDARERRQLGADFGGGAGAGSGQPDGTPGAPDGTPPAATPPAAR